MRLLAGFLLCCALFAQPIPVLIVDGVNNHDWRAATDFLRRTLEKTGKFRVDVSTATPPFTGWRPDFSAYRVVINNFNGGHLQDGVRWPRVVEEDLVRYLRQGGGLVNYHAANNAFLLWPEYQEIVGLLWRDKNFGPGLVVDVQRKVMVVPAGQGPQPGHGPRHDFRINVLDRKHPITRSLPAFWQHRGEQLTHGQHGPPGSMGELHVLTYAWSKDSQRNEPLDWVRRYGRGRVYTTMLGHTWKNEANPNFLVPEFQQLLVQGVEWAATGRVSSP
ncbi:ThuA domain-containing protein [Bryobacter aggregatus]|uniref:ThuA domain-containing protein n=1 Tax=Bryobacter aggregatus TaxID=360054 RepID=UPI0004E0E243|nr:ThuA domain-containing protein [Bryobacter aggregatus]